VGLCGRGSGHRVPTLVAPRAESPVVERLPKPPEERRAAEERRASKEMRASREMRASKEERRASEESPGARLSQVVWAPRVNGGAAKSGA
jgi:hypothetical protein